MIKSMTGFGKTARMVGKKNVVVEIRALNSKFLDLNIKLPSSYKNNEHALRKILAEALIRGKIEMQVEVESEEPRMQSINKKAFHAYYNELNTLADENNLAKTELLNVIMHMPDILLMEEDNNDEEWAEILTVIKTAITQLDEFRVAEGSQLAKDIKQRISSIQEILTEVEKTEKNRIQMIRQRIEEDLNSIKDMVKMNESRLEQEMIYYMEKLDITEERVRLRSHCAYFTEIMDDETCSKGKKLAFVSQEIGREINTIGSKAYDAAIQRLVVEMKDELEKIKEQMNNIL